MAAPFRLYNTRTRKVEVFEPLEPGKVGLYVCGMTVYDDAHIGHARAMVVFDTFVRWLRHVGWQVRFVRNFTDVDDKIIQRSAAAGDSPDALAQRFVDRFHEDMRELGLVRPDVEPRVTGSIAVILELIERLVSRGNAYAAEGNVWFSVPSFERYGALSGQRVDELQSSADAGGGKRHPADFALWKGAKPGEPAWDSPWGPGRPGWHVECSAMAWETLGATIDIHGGGLDLVFPHHENEIAQSECAHGVPYARVWMHNGLLTMDDGRKMGKSEDNAIWIRELLRTYPAEAMRLYYLQSHYRSPLPFDGAALPEALGMLARLYEAREVGERMQGSENADDVARGLGTDAVEVLTLGRALPGALHAALADDFNTAAALGHLFELARAVNRLSNHPNAMKRGGPVVAPALEAFAAVGPALGLLTLSTAAFHDEIKRKRLPALGLTPEQIDALVAERAAARDAKEWAKADAIRDRLEASSIAVMDRAAGSEWRVRL
jgi:cysteinyl-tRNA synthetase